MHIIIKWFAHAAFLVEGQGLRIITDPYKPDVMGFQPITETADIVIRSSDDDNGHCYAEMIPGNPAVVTATQIIPDGTTARGLHVDAVPTQESVIHKEAPLDNAMYTFTLDGVRFAHMGDVGNRLTDTQLDALRGTDVLFALVGGPPTIDLDDLRDALYVIRPRLIIPMHYHLAGIRGTFLPVTAFTDRFPPDRVTWADSSQVVLSRLPEEQEVVVLQPSTLR